MISPEAIFSLNAVRSVDEEVGNLEPARMKLIKKKNENFVFIIWDKRDHFLLMRVYAFSFRIRYLWDVSQKNSPSPSKL